MADQKKYSVSYTSGATGFGWKMEFDTLAEFEDIVDGYRKDYSAMFTVYDYTLHDFVFYKKCLSYKPDIDKLHDWRRDMRTKTRTYK